MVAHHVVEGARQAIQGAAPQSNFGEMQRRGSTQPRRVKILVGDRVAPLDQFVEQLLPAIVLPMVRMNFAPKSNAEAPKVRADVAGAGVPSV